MQSTENSPRDTIISKEMHTRDNQKLIHLKDRTNIPEINKEVFFVVILYFCVS